jgi:hypothetical protein
MQRENKMCRITPDQKRVGNVIITQSTAKLEIPKNPVQVFIFENGRVSKNTNFQKKELPTVPSILSIEVCTASCCIQK